MLTVLWTRDLLFEHYYTSGIRKNTVCVNHITCKHLRKTTCAHADGCSCSSPSLSHSCTRHEPSHIRTRTAPAHSWPVLFLSSSQPLVPCLYHLSTDPKLWAGLRGLVFYKLATFSGACKQFPMWIKWLFSKSSILKIIYSAHLIQLAFETALTRRFRNNGKEKLMRRFHSQNLW